MITSAQIRAARGLLNWTIRDLAEKSGVHKNTVTRIEKEETTSSKHAIKAMITTLEDAGIIFIAENGDGPGVRLKKDA